MWKERNNSTELLSDLTLVLGHVYTQMQVLVQCMLVDTTVCQI